jgi:general secretion pathway protein F
VPAFEYQAVDAKGKKVKGVMEGESARQVRQLLRDKKLMPLKVDAVDERSEGFATGSSNKGSRRSISPGDLALVTRQLSTLVAAAMPLEESLYAVAQQTEKPVIKSMLLGVRSRVVEGYSLSESMAVFPKAFDQLFRAMVAAGEKSGHLEGVLDRLADYTEQRQVMRMKTLQALIYPIVLTLVSIGVISLLLVVVVPQVVEQFQHMGQALPLATRILIGASDFLRDYGLFAVVGIVLLSLLVQRQLRHPQSRFKFHRSLLGWPVIGRVSKGLNTARFARTLSILNASSVPLLEGMGIAGAVLTNDFAKKQLTDAATRVREGGSLHQSLEQTKLFPPMMLHMVASGERSGELESMLERAADNQDREFSNQVTLALGIFEPALIVMMAGIVLFIVMAILQPLLALNTMIGG